VTARIMRVASATPGDGTLPRAEGPGIEAPARAEALPASVIWRRAGSPSASGKTMTRPSHASTRASRRPAAPGRQVFATSAGARGNLLDGQEARCCNGRGSKAARRCVSRLRGCWVARSNEGSPMAEPVKNLRFKGGI
jgi:hypothetical protein